MKCPVTVEEILADLDEIPSMTDAKLFVNGIVNNLQMQQKHIEKKKNDAAVKGEVFKSQPVECNIIIVGNNGKERKKLANILYKLFFAIGVLSTEKFIEIDGLELKGSYLGQSKNIITNLLDTAKGGILFIDEVYNICRDKNDKLGDEAVWLLSKYIRDVYWGKLSVIAAGNSKDMNNFMEIYFPFKASFTHFLKLDDYNQDELKGDKT
jgi:SpoVK/Ycf46/Vps4 family AAA+-type ATPase